MKQILFFTLMLFACSLPAQETIVETDTIEAYQDTLLVIKTTRIVSTGYEGLENISVIYSAPTDSAGLESQVYTSYINFANESVAKSRNAGPFRYILSTYAYHKAFLSLIGRDLDSINVIKYLSNYKGRWRIFNEDNTSFLVDVGKHPTISGLLRATGTNGEGNFNMLLYSEHFFRITLSGGNVQYLEFDDQAGGIYPIYRNPARLTIPQNIVASPNIRMAKIK